MRRILLFSLIVFVNFCCSNLDNKKVLYDELCDKLKELSIQLNFGGDSLQYINQLELAIKKFPDSINFRIMKTTYYALKENKLSDYNSALHELKRVEKLKYGNITVSLLSQLINYKYLGYLTKCDSLFKQISAEYRQSPNLKNANNFLVAAWYINDEDTFQNILESVLVGRTSDEREYLLSNIQGLKIEEK